MRFGLRADPGRARRRDEALALAARAHHRRACNSGLPEGHAVEVEQSADREVVIAWEEALKVLVEGGVSVVDVRLPEPKDLGALYRSVVGYEAFQTHRASLELHGDDYGSAARTRLEEGRRVPAQDYRRALESTRVLRAEVDKLLSVVSVLCLPTQPTIAPRLGSQLAALNDTEISVLPIRGRFTHLASLTGLPSLSIPAGFSQNGLPLGVQLIGRALGEPTLFRLGHAYQQATDWHLRRPPFSDTTCVCGPSNAVPPARELS